MNGGFIGGMADKGRWDELALEEKKWTDSYYEVLEEDEYRYFYLTKSKRENGSYEFFFDGVHLIPCEAVHHVQNAMWCLTGTEIQYNHRVVYSSDVL